MEPYFVILNDDELCYGLFLQDFLMSRMYSKAMGSFGTEPLITTLFLRGTWDPLYSAHLRNIIVAQIRFADTTSLY